MSESASNDDRTNPDVDRLRRVRPVAALVLVILASLLVVLSLVGWWVRTTLFETDSFMEVIETSLSSEEVTTLLGDGIADQVVAVLDVEGRLEEGLAAVDTYLSEALVEALDLSASVAAYLQRVDLIRLADLAAPIAAPVNQTIEEAVDDLVRSDAFQETLPAAVAYAHQGAVALIREDFAELENVAVVDGEVKWDVLPLVTRAIAYVFDTESLPQIFESIEVPSVTYDDPRSESLAALGEAFGRAVPPDFGEVTIMTEEALEDWQSLARTLDRVVLGVILLTVVLAAAAIWLSADRRRTVVQFAFGSVAAVLVAWIVQQNVLAAVDAAIRGPGQRAAVDVLFEAVFANLRSISLFYIVLAGLTGVTAHVAGRPRWLTAVRSRGGPGGDVAGKPESFDQFVAVHRDGFVVAGLMAAVGLWSWVGLSLVSVLIVGAGLGGYLWYVARLASAAEPVSAPRAQV